MSMTDRQQQRLENLEQIAMVLGSHLCSILPPDSQREVEQALMAFGQAAKELGSEGAAHPGEIRRVPRAFKPEFILPGR